MTPQKPLVHVSQQLCSVCSCCAILMLSWTAICQRCIHSRRSLTHRTLVNLNRNQGQSTCSMKCTESHQHPQLCPAQCTTSLAPAPPLAYWEVQVEFRDIHPVSLPLWPSWDPTMLYKSKRTATHSREGAWSSTGIDVELQYIYPRITGLQQSKGMK